MWITPKRIFYYGLLGSPSLRRMGSYTAYVAAESSNIAVSIAGSRWESTEVAVIPPWVPHQVVTDAHFIYTLHIEAETVDSAQLPAELQTCGAVVAPALADQVRGRLREFLDLSAEVDLLKLDFDEAFFGYKLAARDFNPRIVRVLAAIQKQPSAPWAAEECAKIVHLSCSRFLHLFKEQVGIPFRIYRAWKRARNILQFVTQEMTLANVAQDTGYPDSTHFSHSIRQIYGLKPREMFAGSRRLTLFNQAHSLTADSDAINQVGKPDAGNPYTQFDERGQKTGSSEYRACT